MANTPWRRGNIKLEVDASIEHAESSAVPGGLPGAGNGKFWVRNDAPNVPMFTDDAGNDWVLNESGSSAWASNTATTVGASSTNTLATPVSALPDGEQTSVEVQIFGVDDADATNTYFRRQLITYYRDGGNTTQWTVVDSGRDERRGTFPTTLTANLTTSGNDVIVNADTTGVTGTINWTVLYLTREGITAGASTPTQQSTNIIPIVGNDTLGANTAEKYLRIMAPGGTGTTTPGITNTAFLFPAAYGGRMLRVNMICDSDPGSVQFQVYKNFEATASISATASSFVDIGGGRFVGGVDFASTDTFDQDDVLFFSFDPVSANNDASITFTLTYDNVTVGAAQVLSWDTTTRTSSFTALSNQKHKYDASSFSGTISMPASPANGDEVYLKNVSSSTASVTLSGNGNNIESPSTYSLVASTTLSGDGASFTYSFDGTQWFLI